MFLKTTPQWVCAFVVGGILTAASVPVWSLDLSQAYKAAQEQDPRIRAARAGRDAALERIPQARSQLLPSITASAARYKNDLDKYKRTFWAMKYQAATGTSVTTRPCKFGSLCIASHYGRAFARLALSWKMHRRRWNAKSKNWQRE